MDICHICNKKFTDRDKNLKCSICDRPSHALCNNFTSTEFSALQKQISKLHWYCENCQYGAQTLHKQMICLQGKMIKMESRMEAIETRVEQSETEFEKKIDEVAETKIEEKKEQWVGDITQEITAKLGTNLVTTPPEEVADKIKTIATTTVKEEIEKPELYKNLMKELQDREKRKKNIVLHGLTESQKDNAEERTVQDATRSREVLKFISKDLNTTKCHKFLRLGKYDANKKRPIMIEIEEMQAKENILKGTKALKDSQFKDIGISHDLTQQQRAEFRQHLAEAREKSKDGKRYRVVGDPGFWRIKEVDNR